MKIERILEQPTHRAIIDRLTGRPIGPAIPIHPDDWLYKYLRLSEQLWRYMDFWKFEDLLQTSSLYFSRPDKFVDPFEGRLSAGNSTKMSVSDAAFHAVYPIAPVGKEFEASQEIMRQCVFVSCWQRNNKESRKMWDAYTSSADSVVIVSSVNSLYRFVPGSIEKFPVKYHSDDSPRTAFDHTALFFYKPQCYSFEREFRMLLAPGENGPIGSDEAGRHIPISLKKIVLRVITHPKASMQFKAKIDSIMNLSLKRIKRENSTLRA